MDMDFDDWMVKYPEAATELLDIVNEPLSRMSRRAQHRSEAWAQQQVRFDVAKQGGFAFRNNVGATPTRCKKCGAKQAPIRYGLANDSLQMNQRIKSSDLICIIPRKITPDMVGTTIGQFGALECKKPGWKYSATGQEPGQMAWLTFVESNGGFARFVTGTVDLGLK